MCYILSDVSTVYARLQDENIMKEDQPYGSILDTGYFYSPYVPIYTTPTIVDLDELLGIQQNSPLEDLVEGIYEEEIESGELAPVRKKDRWPYERIAVNPDFYEQVTITNL